MFVCVCVCVRCVIVPRLSSDVTDIIIITIIIIIIYMITTITPNTSRNINTVITNKINTTSAVLSFSINIGNESTKYRD